jgi:uncharacterized Zn finger protein (UPF0148 family)
MPAARCEYFIITGGVFILAPAAGPCGRCGTARYHFISRDGQTFCALCDGEMQRQRQLAAQALPVERLEAASA